MTVAERLDTLEAQVKKLEKQIKTMSISKKLGKAIKVVVIK